MNYMRLLSSVSSCLDGNFGMPLILVGFGNSFFNHRWLSAPLAVNRCLGSYTSIFDNKSKPDSFKYGLPEKEVEGNSSFKLSLFPILYWIDLDEPGNLEKSGQIASWGMPNLRYILLIWSTSPSPWNNTNMSSFHNFPIYCE